MIKYSEFDWFLAETENPFLDFSLTAIKLVAVADWITYALFKLYATYTMDHLFTHVHRCTEDVTHYIPNVFMHRQALLRNQIDFCNAPRKARLYGTIKLMKLIIHQSDML